MILFFDIVAKGSIKTWSLNSWKTKYVLNYKNIPYKTVAVEYPEIEGELKKYGIPPSWIRPDGSGLYTCPSIFDESTNTGITDSYKIAQYLDKTYPSTPPVFPKGTEVLQAAFFEQFAKMIDPVRPLLLPRVPNTILTPRGAEYFVRTHSAYLGMPLADYEPKGEARVEVWKNVQAAFDTINGWMGKGDGPFIMGEAPIFVDFVVAGVLKWLQICFGEESEEWKDIQTWNDGKWKDYLASMEPFATEDQ